MHKLAIIQAASVKNFAKNVDTMHRFVKGAQVEGCEAVCFPEAFLTSYDPEDAGAKGLLFLPFCTYSVYGQTPCQFSEQSHLPYCIMVHV